MEIVISNNIPKRFNYQTLGIIGDINDLLNIGFDIEGIDYNDSWTVKRFLNGYHFKLNNRIETFFNMFDLSTSILNKRIKEISSTDFKFILLIYAMLKNKKVIIFDHIDTNMCLKDRKRLINFVRKVKNDDMSFIFLSNNLEFLYKINDHLIIFEEGKIIFDDLIDDAYKEQIDSNIINFINMANKKGANLIYTFDRKELLKDIYRSVS